MPKPSHVLTLPTLHPHAAELRDAILNKLTYSCSKTPSNAGPYDWYLATVLAVRDRMVDRWLESEQRTERKHSKRVYYLSIEFLIGRLLFDSLINLACSAPRARRSPASASISISSASSSPTRRSATAASAGSPPATWTAWRRSASPAYGYGIRYEHGLFKQQIRDGWQHELPERLAGLRQSVGVRAARRPNIPIRFGGSVEYVGGDRTARRAASGIRPSACSRWRYDTPIAGWRGRHVNTLRLWSARVDDAGASRRVQPGRLWSARRRRARRPKRSRACSIRATPRRRARSCGCGRSISSPRRRCRTSCGAICSSSTTLDSLPEHVAIQLNDTHPAIAVAELMRILVDEHDCSLERRLAHHHGDAELHQPHAAAGGAGELAGGAARTACCRGTCRSSIVIN